MPDTPFIVARKDENHNYMVYDLDGNIIELESDIPYYMTSGCQLFALKYKDKLLELGLSIELVAEGTGLSLEQIQQLQQQSDHSSQNSKENL